MPTNPHGKSVLKGRSPSSCRWAWEEGQKVFIAAGASGDLKICSTFDCRTLIVPNFQGHTAEPGCVEEGGREGDSRTKDRDQNKEGNGSEDRR